MTKSCLLQKHHILKANKTGRCSMHKQVVKIFHQTLGDFHIMPRQLVNQFKNSALFRSQRGLFPSIIIITEQRSHRRLTMEFLVVMQSPFCVPLSTFGWNPTVNSRLKHNHSSVMTSGIFGRRLSQIVMEGEKWPD